MKTHTTYLRVIKSSYREYYRPSCMCGWELPPILYTPPGYMYADIAANALRLHNEIVINGKLS